MSRALVTERAKKRARAMEPVTVQVKAMVREPERVLVPVMETVPALALAKEKVRAQVPEQASVSAD